MHLGLVDNHCKAIHVRLAMMQSVLHAYNASGQLVSSAKGTFVEIPKTRLVMQVGMVNPLRLNVMETLGFPSAKPSAQFRGTGPVVYNCFSCQTQAKGAFDALMHHKTNQL